MIIGKIVEFYVDKDSMLDPVRYEHSVLLVSLPLARYFVWGVTEDGVAGAGTRLHRLDLAGIDAAGAAAGDYWTVSRGMWDCTRSLAFRAA